MRTKFVEVTNGPNNWGKFLIAEFTDEDRAYKSVIDGCSLINSRGWTTQHIMVFDLQTGEGALFRLGGHATSDLKKHKIWVCPMFEPFLTWLYEQPDPLTIPAHVDLPDAPFAISGYRRPGPDGA